MQPMLAIQPDIRNRRQTLEAQRLAAIADNARAIPDVQVI
jgi:hypothetical protein